MVAQMRDGAMGKGERGDSGAQIPVRGGRGSW